MELKVDMPALASQSVDPAAFQRVWDRVMPNQAAPRSDAVPPVTIPDTSVPAEPSPPPEETVPPEQLPSVPDCASQPDAPGVTTSRSSAIPASSAGWRHARTRAEQPPARRLTRSATPSSRSQTPICHMTIRPLS